MFRKYWWRDYDATNRGWAAEVMKRVASLSPSVPDRIASLYGRPRIARGIRVDVVPSASREGAFSTTDPAPAHITGLRFQLEVPLDIGKPPKSHVFDLAKTDRLHVGEAKAFTWTVRGNVPSAKTTTLREAAQYLNWLPPNAQGFIIMARENAALADFTTLTSYRPEAPGCNPSDVQARRLTALFR